MTNQYFRLVISRGCSSVVRACNLVEHATHNRLVVGSIPTGPTKVERTIMDEKIAWQQATAKCQAQVAAQAKEIASLQAELEIYKQELEIATAEIHRLSRD